MRNILIFILFLGIINASPFGLDSLNQFKGTNPKIDLSKDKKLSKKTYKELIKALETAPSGEYSLYLAIIYLNGIDKPDSVGDTVKPDKEKALTYFNKAIELGYYNAAQILGSLYLYHKDFIKEPDHIKKAIYYLNIALKNGLYDSTTALADIYFNYKNDKKMGLKYLKMGAEHNIPTAQFMLAVLYNWGVNDGNGFVILKDPYTAQMLLTKACTNKNITPKVKEMCYSSYIKKKKRGGSNE